LKSGDEAQATLFGQYMVERLLFVPLPYIPYVYDGPPQEQLVQSLNESIPKENSADITSQLATAS